MNLTTVKAAAAELGMSTNALYKCISLGAPVHRWGPTGKQYRIDTSELIAWTDRHGNENAADQKQTGSNLIPLDNAAVMAARRHDMINALKGA